MKRSIINTLWRLYGTGLILTHNLDWLYQQCALCVPRESINSVLPPCSISQQRITGVAVNDTGEWLAFGCRGLGQLLVWEWQSETYVLKQQGHFYDMNVLSYSPDGQVVATGGDDGKVDHVWL